MRRTGVLKKGTTSPANPEVVEALQQCSKAALLDCLLDVIAMAEGCADNAVELRIVAGYVNPRLVVRGDKLIAV
jgi:hypothetical protein